IELAEAEVAVGDEGAHAELGGQDQGLPGVTRTPGTQFRNPPGASQTRVFRDQRFADRGRSMHPVQPRRNHPGAVVTPLESRRRIDSALSPLPLPMTPKSRRGASCPGRPGAAENCPMGRCEVLAGAPVINGYFRHGSIAAPDARDRAGLPFYRAQLVERAARVAAEVGRKPAAPAETRALLRLT